MKPREKRHDIQITARMKVAGGWQDVAIRNVSAHGMKISVAYPPQRGAYIEIRRASQIVVARAVWVSGKECGLRTQDVIDIPALVHAHAAKAEKVIGAHNAERRAAPRADDVAARSKRFARHFQWIAIGSVGLAAAAGIAFTVGETIAKPFVAVEHALSGGSAKS